MIVNDKLPDLLSKFVDAKYALCNPSQGWDCLNSLIEFYDSLGIEFPREFEGWTESNYAERFSQDPDEGRKVFSRFLSTLGTPVKMNYFLPGDLMIFDDGSGTVFPAICSDNGNILIVIGKKHGVKMFPLETFRSKLKEIRRLII